MIIGQCYCYVNTKALVWIFIIIEWQKPCAQVATFYPQIPFHYVMYCLKDLYFYFYLYLLCKCWSLSTVDRLNYSNMRLLNSVYKWDRWNRTSSLLAIYHCLHCTIIITESKLHFISFLYYNLYNKSLTTILSKLDNMKSSVVVFILCAFCISYGSCAG